MKTHNQIVHALRGLNRKFMQAASAAASGYDVPAGVLRDYPKIVKRGE